MEETNLYRARIQVVEAMEQGLPWHEAAKRAGLQISQSTAYRLRQRMRKAGEEALREGRGGRREREVCCCWLLPMKLHCSPSWKLRSWPARITQRFLNLQLSVCLNHN